VLCALRGGIRLDAFSAKMRSTSRLFSGWPGTMAPALTASSRRSSRRSAWRAALSGPWQAKQLSAKIGRTSRLYSSWPAARAEQDLEPGQHLREEAVAARLGDPVVQPAIDGPGPLDEAVAAAGLDRHQLLEVGGQRVQIGQVDPAARRAGRLALQGPADLAD